jgi:hypothetical protein
MIDAALYLSSRSTVNSLRRRLERLRQPRYLIGFLIGIGYFYWVFVGPRSARSAMISSPAIGSVVAAMGLGAVVLFTWVFGSAETPFAFQLAETDFLFTAPLTRRAVIQFRLLRSQVALFASAALSVLIFSRADLATRVLIRLPALWLMYLTLQLHGGGAALVRASLTEQGLTGIRRRILTLAVIAAVLGGLWWGLRDAIPPFLATVRVDPEAAAAQLAQTLHRGILGVVLWPLFAVTGPLVATSLGEFALRLPTALAVAAVHYVWVVSSTLSFEEAAVEHANKVARRIEALRRGRTEAPRVRRGGTVPLFPLGARGAPAAAIVWKNATGAVREFRLRSVLLILVCVVAMGVAVGSGGDMRADVVALFALLFAGLIVLFGPLTLRYDLRRDLEMLDVLKSAPLRGHAVVGAEVLGPALVLSAAAILGWTAAFVASLASASSLPATGDRLALLFAACVGTPPVVTALLLMQNAAALLFPAWSAIGPERATGFEATGQRILSFVGTAIGLLVAVLPAAIVGAGAAVAVRSLGASPAWAITAWSAVGAPVLAAECYLGVRLLGPVLEKLEPAGVK